MAVIFEKFIASFLELAYREPQASRSDGYGPTDGKPMTEDLPLAATTVKGRTRAAMTDELLTAAADGRVRVAIGRASDFFGPGVTQGSTLGERVFGNALAARRADFIGDL